MFKFYTNKHNADKTKNATAAYPTRVLSLADTAFEMGLFRELPPTGPLLVLGESLMGAPSGDSACGGKVPGAAVHPFWRDPVAVVTLIARATEFQACYAHACHVMAARIALAQVNHYEKLIVNKFRQVQSTS